MDAVAVEHARARLRKAEKAFEAFKSATNYDDAEEAWTDFLLAAAGIYSKLEQGAKGHNKSDPWFGDKKYERKKDDLLRYLHFARNSDEHGIERVVGRVPSSTLIGGRPLAYGQRVPLQFTVLDESGNPTGPLRDAFAGGARIKLIRAHDRRFNQYCDPPRTHLGQAVPYWEEPKEIGERALAYLAAMISEAATLVRKS